MEERVKVLGPGDIDDIYRSLVRGYIWKARMFNGALFEFWTPLGNGDITRKRAREELLLIANGEYPGVYSSADIVNLWRTKGGK